MKTAPARLSAADVEQAFNVELPAALNEMMAASTPTLDQWGAAIIWSAEDMIAHNLEMRSPELAELYMPFDHLLFIGMDSSGDQFGLAIAGDGQIHRNDIFRWSHESDSRVCYAGDVQSYICARQAPEEGESLVHESTTTADQELDAYRAGESDADFQQRMLARLGSTGR